MIVTPSSVHGDMFERVHARSLREGRREGERSAGIVNCGLLLVMRFVDNQNSTQINIFYNKKYCIDRCEFKEQICFTLMVMTISSLIIADYL